MAEKNKCPHVEGGKTYVQKKVEGTPTLRENATYTTSVGKVEVGGGPKDDAYSTKNLQRTCKFKMLWRDYKYACSERRTLTGEGDRATYIGYA